MNQRTQQQDLCPKGVKRVSLSHSDREPVQGIELTAEDLVSTIRFTNRGCHSKMGIGIGDTYEWIRPGQHVEYSVSGPYYLCQRYRVKWETENQAMPDGAGNVPALDPNGVVHIAIVDQVHFIF